MSPTQAVRLQYHRRHREFVHVAGGIMAILAIVLVLAYIHAVLGLINRLRPQAHTVLLKDPNFIPNTIDQALSSVNPGLDKREVQANLTYAESQESGYSEYGHPVWLHDGTPDCSLD